LELVESTYGFPQARHFRIKLVAVIYSLLQSRTSAKPAELLEEFEDFSGC
jgi:hypothetical protein